MHRLQLILVMVIASSLSQDEVVITSFPSSGFIIRSDPFLLSCTAINAVSIRFRCNHKWLDESRQSSIEGVDESKGLRYLQSSINITKSGEESEERCDCYAVGKGDRTVKSEKEAVISTAFMRKHFDISPQSSRVKEGSQIALPCIPPLSHPIPTIEWTKDGESISLDNYRIMASDGSLLLSSARLQDGGSYVCTARNVAGSRVAPPAHIHVYVDGGWSEWSEWTGLCNVDCTQLIAVVKLRGHDVIPRISRRRLCNNPAPLNGGLTCNGDDEESSQCPLDCSLDGGWSEWEGWSECSSLCISKRQRSCTQPSPLNGGNDCGGERIDTIPCSSGICSSQWSLSDWIVVVCLLAVFLLLSILFSLCILLLCRQKGSKTTPYYGDIASYKSGMVVENGPPFIQSSHPSMTMMSTKSAYARCESGAYSISRGGESRQALLEGSSTASSGRKAFLTTTTSSLSEDDNYATVYECVGGEELVEGECVLPARVDREGGRLSMDKSRTSLLIGEGSLDSPTLVILSTRSPSDDLPLMEDGEIPVSSLISISSSSSIVPRFPFVLSFTHSIQSIDQWTVSLYSHSHYGWDRYELDEDNPPPSPIFAQFNSLSPSTVQCTIPHYGKFLLCARPKKLNPLQRMRVAVFTPIDRRDHFPLRVLIVPEGSGWTDIHKEEGGGRLVAESPLCVYMDGGPLCVCIEEMNDAYRVINNNYKEMNLSSQSSHSFQIESTGHNQPFSARLVLLQKGSSSPPLILSLSLDDDYDQLVMTEDTRVSLDFVLPHSIKQRISSLLDPPSERDWTSLARSLGASPFVVFGRALSSPTTVLLTLWEARREDPCHLSHALRLSGRPEVAQLVDKCMR
ncbi:hypothetical protein PFISCL1PPCAC_15717 [Pristionchus fissidentatus]|uniref:Netrin receptor UNC5 n=1 Tax=Pristionchus fissidentatus TaxID=1538716 RepID=A0AAV5W267_9BILA|nr:hypothetical protein PFISCL1PPCAC_15717 [Pristionchus fissidentatus]